MTLQLAHGTSPDTRGKAARPLAPPGRRLSARHRKGDGATDVTVRRVLEAQGITFGPPKTTNQRTSPETEALVLRLYDQDYTWEQINEQAGITSVDLGKILKRNGREYDRRSDAEGNAEIITALYKAGRSTRAIAEMLGHGKTTVGSIVVRHRWHDAADTGLRVSRLLRTDRHPGEGVLARLHRRRRVRRSHPAVSRRKPSGCPARRPGQRPPRETEGGPWRHCRCARPDRGGVREAQTAKLASLSVGSRRLTKALVALGVTPRKSGTLQPWDGPADLMPHYWRGMVDGGGRWPARPKASGQSSCVALRRASAHSLHGQPGYAGPRRSRGTETAAGTSASAGATRCPAHPRPVRPSPGIAGPQAGHGRPDPRSRRTST